MRRQTKAGEWWFSPDGENRAFYVGLDGDGDPLWEIAWNEFNDNIPPNYVPVPECTGWDWELPALPDGHELCGPPKTISETTWTRRLTRNSSSPWQPCYCYIDEDTTGEFTHCKPIKPAELGPQQEPSNVAKIVAELRQLAKKLEELEVTCE
jgi:hypothetical protein